MHSFYYSNQRQRKATVAYFDNPRYTAGTMTAMTEAPPNLLTVAQAAAYLQVSIDTVRRWCRTGELRCTFLGDRAGYRIRQSDLDLFLERRDNTKA